MKKAKIFLLSLIIIICVGFASYKIWDVFTQNKSVDDSQTQTEEQVHIPTIEEQVDEQISQMSLKEKIGQMIFIFHSGTQYDEELDNIMKEVMPGGFILFNDNIESYAQTSEYISKIKNAVEIPILIGVDQEGGRVQRIKNLPDVNALEIPNMYSLGQTHDKELANKVGKVVAQEIAAFGINLDFAPSLDVFSNPSNTVIGNRAFGSDAQTVIDMAIPFSKGMIEGGVIPVYKHFPGHGDTVADSHVELPVVNKTKEELESMELLTFKSAIEEGAQMIMTAHIALPNVTGNYMPATLSKEVITGILRDELGFDGVVITDAINMKALSDNYTLEEICNKTINAGVDMILMPIDAIATVQTIENLVQSNQITEDRINESVKRILLMKYNNKLNEEKELNVDVIGSQEHIDIVEKLKELITKQ